MNTTTELKTAHFEHCIQKVISFQSAKCLISSSIVKVLYPESVYLPKIHIKSKINQYTNFSL